MSRKIVVIGGGIAGLSCASYLAADGNEVVVLEKNECLGGRARKFEQDGFTFDMGPSWYWMPEVFEKFYRDFGFEVSDFYELLRLDPSYQVIWKDKSADHIPASLEEFKAWFEKLEKGSAAKLDAFLKEAAYKYDVGMNDLVQKPGLSFMEFADKRVVGGVFKMHLFSSFSKYIKKYFSHPKIIELLEFPILFLGAMPKDTPALYSLMNYADIVLGTWYPKGGMHEIIKAFEAIALKQGVEIKLNSEVVEFNYTGNKISSVKLKNGESFECDYLVSGADYAHTEFDLLKDKANYSKKYWEGRTMAPSSLLFYLGVDKKIPKLQHHNLFFDEDFNAHAEEIYSNPSWPKSPLFYACCPSKTDEDVAPEGKENLFLLVPIAPDLKDDDAQREHYYTILMKRLEEFCGEKIADHVIFKRSYCVSDFKKDYHAFKGNAYGLANTLKQTAILKPQIKSKKVPNMYYTGQLTVPGPGVPPSIISGKVVATELIKSFKA